MKEKEITGKIVTLVAYPEYLSVLLRPQIGEYTNPQIKKLLPCIKYNDGSFVDLRTGVDVKRDEYAQEWLNLSGTVFRYPDGHNVLIAKKLDGSNSFIAKEIVEGDIRNDMVLRLVLDRTKEKNIA